MGLTDIAGFTKDRAVGLAVAGTIGFAAERAAGAVPISLSPLLYATAFGIVLGNSLRLVDPTMKRMAPTEIGMAFAKRRLLRAGIILYGAKVTFGAILGIGAAGLLTDLYVVSSTLALGFAGGRLLGLSELLLALRDRRLDRLIGQLTLAKRAHIDGLHQLVHVLAVERYARAAHTVAREAVHARPEQV